MPALVKREGFEIAHVDVVDRPRHAGRSNYGLFDRLWVGILDLAGVWWLIRRRRNLAVVQELAVGQELPVSRPHPIEEPPVTKEIV